MFVFLDVTSVWLKGKYRSCSHSDGTTFCVDDDFENGKNIRVHSCLFPIKSESKTGNTVHRHQVINQASDIQESSTL